MIWLKLVTSLLKLVASLSKLYMDFFHAYFGTPNLLLFGENLEIYNFASGRSKYGIYWMTIASDLDAKRSILSNIYCILFMTQECQQYCIRYILFCYILLYLHLFNCECFSGVSKGPAGFKEVRWLQPHRGQPFQRDLPPTRAGRFAQVRPD